MGKIRTGASSEIGLPHRSDVPFGLPMLLQGHAIWNGEPLESPAETVVGRFFRPEEVSEFLSRHQDTTSLSMQPHAQGVA
jgi:hypothetical protein